MLLTKKQLLLAALIGSQLPTILVLLHISAENIQAITKINAAVFTIKAMAHFILSITWVMFLNGNNKTFRQAVESAVTAPILVLTLLQGNPYNTNNSAIPTTPQQYKTKIEQRIDSSTIKAVSDYGYTSNGSNIANYNSYAGCKVFDYRESPVPTQSTLSWIWQSVTSSQITQVDNTGFAVLTHCVYEANLNKFVTIACEIADKHPITVFKCPYNPSNYTISFGTRLTYSEAKNIKERFANSSFDLRIYEKYK